MLLPDRVDEIEAIFLVLGVDPTPYIDSQGKLLPNDDRPSLPDGYHFVERTVFDAIREKKLSKDKNITVVIDEIRSDGDNRVRPRILVSDLREWYKEKTGHDLLCIKFQGVTSHLNAKQTLTAAPNQGNVGKTSNKRNDALATILIKIINEYKEQHCRYPQCNEIMNKLKSLTKVGNHKIIQEVVDGKVEWRDAKGRDKTTSSKQIQNRLTRLKKL